MYSIHCIPYVLCHVNEYNDTYMYIYIYIVYYSPIVKPG